MRAGGEGAPSRKALRFLLASFFLGCAAVALAAAVLAGVAAPFDQAVVATLARGPLAPFAPPGALFGWAELSAPGSGIVTIVVTLFVTSALFAARRWVAGFFCLVALSGGYGLMFVLKALVARSRPTLDLGEALNPASLGLASWDPASGAFPSGHAMLSVVVYGYLASSLPARLRPLGWLFALLIAFVVGVSRVAIGAHWPSDVLGGWLIGAAWLFAVLSIRSALQPRIA